MRSSFEPVRKIFSFFFSPVKIAKETHFSFVRPQRLLQTQNESSLLLDYVGGISTLP